VADGFITIILGSQLPSTHSLRRDGLRGSLTALGAVLRGAAEGCRPSA
jgi:hypothetical protein